MLISIKLFTVNEGFGLEFLPGSVDRYLDPAKFRLLGRWSAPIDIVLFLFFETAGSRLLANEVPEVFAKDVPEVFANEIPDVFREVEGMVLVCLDLLKFE